MDISKTTSAHSPRPGAYGGAFKKSSALFLGEKPVPHCHGQQITVKVKC